MTKVTPTVRTVHICTGAANANLNSSIVIRLVNELRTTERKKKLRYSFIRLRCSCEKKNILRKKNRFSKIEVILNVVFQLIKKNYVFYVLFENIIDK